MPQCHSAAEEQQGRVAVHLLVQCGGGPATPSPGVRHQDLAGGWCLAQLTAVTVQGSKALGDEWRMNQLYNYVTLERPTWWRLQILPDVPVNQTGLIGYSLLG